ncbi:MAG: hypothetical protein R2724_31000 [Bryobacterales bacterium]
MRLTLLIALCCLMDAARSFSPEQGLEGNTGGVTLAGGFLLLTAFLGGACSAISACRGSPAIS